MKNRVFFCLVSVLLFSTAQAVTAGPIHDAVLAGDLAKVKALVAENPKVVNEKNDLEQTPLHLAAAARKKDIVDFLIAKGADTKAVGRDGRSLLHFAAAGGMVELMDSLIKSGFPLDAPDRYGRTPLLRAAEAGSDQGAEFLLARGANAKSRDYYQQTPLHKAAFAGNLRLCAALVENGADVNAVNEEGSTPLLYVSQAGRGDVIDWLLDHGATLNVRNKFNETPLTFPLGNGFLELVQKLWPRVEALGDRDFLERYPLHRMAYLGNDQGAAFLLEKGLPIDLRDESGRTPFQRAAQGGNVDIAQRLLVKGANVDAPDPAGSAPLHLAAMKGRTGMVRFLLEKGAAPQTKDGKGRTPLFLAKEYGYPGIAELLKAAGAEPAADREAPDVASLLAKPLQDGQAIVWSLGHCGFAVKTRNRLLIFDYFSRGGRPPDKPSLANGFINPEEIKDLEVVVFASHSHGDHFDPVILTWKPTVINIRYVFGWNAGKGEGTFEMPAPRAKLAFDGMEIFTVNDEHDTVPEVAYLVKVDGLAIYHAGDYAGPLDRWQDDMSYLLKNAGTIDLAFLARIQQAEALKPRVVFPIHGYNREFMYGAFGREAAERKLPSQVIIPENKGDRHDLFLPGQEKRFALTYVANMGVLVESGGAKVLIDALFDKPNPEYRAPDPETLDRIIKGTAPFDGVGLALITHNHPDHFNAQIAVRFLEASPETILMAPADAVDEMRKAEADWPKIESRVIAIDLPIGKNEIRTAAGIPLTIVRTLHDSSESPMNLMYLFDLNGRRIFHKGDSPGLPEIYQGFGLEAAPVDLAIVHYWFPLVPNMAKFLQEVFQPEHIALCHLPIRLEGDAPGKIDMIRKYYKDIFLLLPGMPEKILLNSK